MAESRLSGRAETAGPMVGRSEFCVASSSAGARHRQTLPREGSCDAVASMRPSGENRNASTVPLCLSVIRSSPVGTSQITTLLSALPEAIVVPSGEKANAQTKAVCFFKTKGFIAALQMHIKRPKLDLAVRAAHGQHFAIGRVGHALARRAADGRRVAGSQIDDIHRPRVAWPTAAERLHTASELPSGEKAMLTGVTPWLIDCGRRAARAEVTEQEFSRFELAAILARAHCQRAAVGRNGHATDGIVERRESSALGLTGLEVPNADRFVDAAGEQLVGQRSGSTQVITPPCPCWPAGLPSPRKTARGL